MEKIEFSDLYSECVPFQNSGLYHSSEHTDVILSRKLLLEFLNPEGRKGVAKTLSALVETYEVEAALAARYYFACGVKAAEKKESG